MEFISLLLSVMFGLALVTLCLIGYLRFNRIKGIPYSSPPGLMKLVVNLPHFHNEILRLTKKYDGLFQTRVLFNNMVFIMRPDLVKEALTKVTNKGWIYEILAFIPGCMSIFEADTQEWEPHSKCFKNSFSISAINNNASEPTYHFVDKFCSQLRDRIRQNQGKAEVHVDNLFSALTIDIISKAGFNYDMCALDSSPQSQDFARVIGDYLFGLTLTFGNPFFQLFFWRSEVIKFNKAFKQLVVMTSKILDHVLSHASEMKEDDKTIASGLVKLSQQPNITRNHLISEVRTFFFAGHDTTGHTLSFICYLLAANPHVQLKGQAEVETYLKSNPDRSANSCPDYVDAIIKEGMRILPVAPSGSVRRVTDPNGVTIGKHLLPQGTWISTPSYATQNWDKVWGDDVGEFKPERWLNGKDGTCQVSPQGLGGYSGVHMNDKVNEVCFSPFSMGLRKCIGMNLAIMELRATIMSILSQFTLELPDDLKNVPYGDMAVFEFTLKPKANLRLLISMKK